MRHSAGKGSHRFHLLGLSKFVLQGLFLTFGLQDLVGLQQDVQVGDLSLRREANASAVDQGLGRRQDLRLAEMQLGRCPRNQHPVLL